VAVARKARALLCERKPFSVELEDGSTVSARTIIIATGASYRKLAVPDLARFEARACTTLPRRWKPSLPRG
jgi:thioredoxin reductase (NADPH)